MIDDSEWTRLARYFAGECAPEEAEAICRWLEADPERQRAAAALRTAWDAAAVPGMAWDTPASWQRLAARIRTRERRAAVALVQPAAPRWQGRSRWWPAAAAAAAVAVAGGLFWRAVPRRTPGSSAAMVREVRTAPTQRTAFRLADGSRVVLAPGSVLRYDAASFGHPRRELSLEGGAYFEVAHDARRPFVVRTARTVTEDLGTEFAVTDYPTDRTVEVVVASGVVAVRSAAAGRQGAPVILGKNQLLQIDSAGRVVARHDIDAAPRTAWTEGRLVFAGAPVPDVVRDLERWYGLRIQLGDTSLVRQRFTAAYTTEPDSVVLREFATAIGARVVRRGPVIVLVR